MTLPDHICARLNKLGAAAEVKTDGIHVTLNGVTTRIRFDPEWQNAFATLRKARSSHFDVSDWSFALNTTLEFPLAKLDSDLYRENEGPKFTDVEGNEVAISRASIAYSLAHFNSADYDRYFDLLIRVRLSRIPPKFGRSLTVLFRTPLTATYTASGRRTPINFKSKALERIRACLLKLAVERHNCYELLRPKAVSSLSKLDHPNESDWLIPRVTYDSSLVSYYKVARSSPFASQSFLSYYHVLEYYFLRVAEDSLHHQLKTLLNKPNFSVTSDGLDRVISVVRKQATQDDETEMLRKVLQRFVPEDDFIEFVAQLENVAAEKLYTKRRNIFGEHLEISLKEGHAISNAAKILKHVRNAIVHSSDKYKREECHIPLTESEGTIAGFVPIVKYFAEQVIFGTANPQEF